MATREVVDPDGKGQAQQGHAEGQALEAQPEEEEVTAPQIPIGPPKNLPRGPVERRLASDGQKPQSDYKAAARRRADRNYTPRYDIIDA